MPIDRVIEDKQRLFWLLQLGGWSSWAATFYLSALLWGTAEPERYAVYLPVIASLGMLITLALRWIYRITWDRSIGIRAFALLGASYCAGVVWALSRSVIFFNLYPDMQAQLDEAGASQFRAYFERSISAVWVMLVWSALYFGIKYYLVSQREKERYLRAISMAQEAQLKMLRYQLNPHFLFNTLNAISTLVLDQDTKLANSMVMKLSRFLRYSLDNDPMQQVTVTEEVESLRLYLDIEKVRFGERLTLHFTITPEAERALMPSLLLQPLVENSIKYAVSQSIHGGSIAVAASIEEGSLQLQVADDGPGLDLRHGRLPKGGGVGLANTRERLAQVYGDGQSFRLSTTEPHGLTITIRLPVSYATEEAA